MFSNRLPTMAERASLLGWNEDGNSYCNLTDRVAIDKYLSDLQSDTEERLDTLTFSFDPQIEDLNRNTQVLNVYCYPGEIEKLSEFGTFLEMCREGIAFPMFLPESPDNRGLDVHRANLVIFWNNFEEIAHIPFEIFTGDDADKETILSTLIELDVILKNRLKIIPSSFFIQSFGFIFGEFGGGGAVSEFNKTVIPTELKLAGINKLSGEKWEFARNQIYRHGITPQELSVWSKIYELGEKENLDHFFARLTNTGVFNIRDIQYQLSLVQLGELQPSLPGFK